MAINKVVYGSRTLVDLTSDTVTPTALVEGYTAHDDSGEIIEGRIANRGVENITISDKDQTHTDGVCFHGRLMVSLDSTEKAKIVPENIKEGVNILGVDGSYNPPSGDTLFVGEMTTGSSNAQSISFTGLPAKPKAFAVIKMGDLTSASTRYILDVWYTESIGVRNHTAYKNGSTTTIYTYTTMTYTYSNGTLTIKTASTSNTGYFKGSATHRLIAIC